MVDGRRGPLCALRPRPGVYRIRCVLTSPPFPDEQNWGRGRDSRRRGSISVEDGPAAAAAEVLCEPDDGSTTITEPRPEIPEWQSLDEAQSESGEGSATASECALGGNVREPQRGTPAGAVETEQEGGERTVEQTTRETPERLASGPSAFSGKAKAEAAAKANRVAASWPFRGALPEPLAGGGRGYAEGTGSAWGFGREVGAGESVGAAATGPPLERLAGDWRWYGGGAGSLKPLAGGWRWYAEGAGIAEGSGRDVGAGESVGEAATGAPLELLAGGGRGCAEGAGNMEAIGVGMRASESVGEAADVAPLEPLASGGREYAEGAGSAEGSKKDVGAGESVGEAATGAPLEPLAGGVRGYADGAGSAGGVGSGMGAGGSVREHGSVCDNANNDERVGVTGSKRSRDENPDSIPRDGGPPTVRRSVRHKGPTGRRRKLGSSWVVVRQKTEQSHKLGVRKRPAKQGDYSGGLRWRRPQDTEGEAKGGVRQDGPQARSATGAGGAREGKQEPTTSKKRTAAAVTEAGEGSGGQQEKGPKRTRRAAMRDGRGAVGGASPAGLGAGAAGAPAGSARRSAGVGAHKDEDKGKGRGRAR